MRAYTKIQKLTALLLLFVLTLSTTPKAFIHTLFADHKDIDNSCAHISHDAPCVKTASINCHFNDLVVNLPYIDQVETITQLKEISFSDFQVTEVSTYYSCDWLSKDNRGPPLS